MRKTSWLILASFFLLIFMLPLVAQAFTVKTQNTIYIPADEIMVGTLYTAGNTITIDGTVKGDVICAGQTININGTVEGDVICAGQNVNINGPVNGSVRVAGNSISISNIVARNVQALGASIALSPQASVGWDMFLAGAFADIRGNVGGDLHGAAANVLIAGEIGRDVKLRLNEKTKGEAKGVKKLKPGDPLTITESAKIGGNVYYTAGREGAIDDSATIGGEVGFTQSERDTKSDLATISFFGLIYSVFAAMVVGLVIISLWRVPITGLTEKMQSKTSSSIGWGLALMFLTPIIALLLVITIIGIPLAVIIVGIWLIALYLSKILIAILVGRSLIKRFKNEPQESLVWAMIIGVVIVWLITAIPLVGWIFALVAMWWGLGGIWLYFRKS